MPEELTALIEAAKRLRDAHRRVMDAYSRSCARAGDSAATAHYRDVFEQRRRAMVAVARAYEVAELAGALVPRAVGSCKATQCGKRRTNKT